MDKVRLMKNNCGKSEIKLPREDFELFKNKFVSAWMRDKIKDSFEWEGVMIRRG